MIPGGLCCEVWETLLEALKSRQNTTCFERDAMDLLAIPQKQEEKEEEEDEEEEDDEMGMEKGERGKGEKF